MIGVVFSVSQYSGGSLHSNFLDSVHCFLPPDLEAFVSEKTVLENEISDLNNQLTKVNEDTIKNSENITKINTDIETLNKELVTDFSLEQKKEIVDKIYQELTDRKNIDTLKTELQTKQQFIDDQLDPLKTIELSLADNTSVLNVLKLQMVAKAALESQEKPLA